jgi:hypothetical protein
MLGHAILAGRCPPLTTAKLSPDAQGSIFDVDRTKTGKGAIGTLSKRTQLLLKWYVGQLPFTLHPDTPIFHTRGGQPGPKGGRPRPPIPYTKDRWVTISALCARPSFRVMAAGCPTSADPARSKLWLARSIPLRSRPRWPTRSMTAASHSRPTCRTKLPSCAWLTRRERADSPSCAARPRTEKVPRVELRAAMESNRGKGLELRL